MGLDPEQAPALQFESIKQAAYKIKEPTGFYVGSHHGEQSVDKEEVRLWLEEYYGVPYKIEGEFALPA